MADLKACPICETIVPASAQECPNCGADLAKLGPAGRSVRNRSQESAARPARRVAPQYSSALGEDDLFAPLLLRFPWWGILLPVVVVGVVIVVCGLLVGMLLSQRIGFHAERPREDMYSTAVPTLSLGGATATPWPTLNLPTLTATRTPTITPTLSPTPGPCEQTVQAGDTLIMLAMRCGHRDLAVIDIIVEMNGLRSAESLQLGQRILIPWPTPTPGPAPVEGGVESGAESNLVVTSSGGDSGQGGVDPTQISDVIPTATLQPGVAWYVVQPGDNIIKVALEFNANIEILSQLNPEVTFSQCDFGMDSGGGNCIVQLYEGQLLRVPAPTPTPTLSPTPSGSETPTPTPTPTFNAPSLFSPGDRSLFRAGELVTLRWVTTGTLNRGDVYLITVIDTTLGVTHTNATRETLYILPSEWQPSDGQRHLFTWSVAVGPSDGSGGLASITFSTPSWLFFWDSP